VERALYSVERMLSREKEISTRNKLKAITRIKELKGDVKLWVKASQVLEKLEKSAVTNEEVAGYTEVKKRLEISQYSIDDIDRLLDAGKTEIVAEMAKLDPDVMDIVLSMLESDNYSRRLDALWIVARLTSYLTPSNAYRILPVLGDFLKSKNPWARETAARVLADIYAIYPGTSKFFSSLLDILLKSGKERDVEGALELMARLSDKLSSKETLSGMLKLVLKLLDDERTRGVTLRVLAREAQKLLDIDTEDLFALKDKLKEIYGKDGGRYDEIIASLIDVIDDILKMRRQGIVPTSG
jgi:RNAse (barnase) inhibitor barstar